MLEKAIREIIIRANVEEREIPRCGKWEKEDEEKERESNRERIEVEGAKHS